jgi:flagellar basal-body rod modification protein FlgD
MGSLAAILNMPNTLHQFAPNFGTGPLKSTGTKANAAGTTGTTATTTSSGTSGTPANIGSTFLSLLAQELQNQDPTAPVDSTAMVGQMISLSQLGQLVSMNQILSAAISNPTTPTTPTGQSQTAAASPNSAALTSAINGIANSLSPSAAGAATSQLPFDPNTMMPLGFGNANAAAASINSALNTSTLGLSGTNNNPTGGK